ncbi:MAG: GIY-YIG nuclease family protein [Candidatus Nomurabacteria bacterium]|jgi:excinuclease ABC subunit C|nr:GIY-YIG nuclease family protein [Candidatus Nomurabacteria bacterium]
MNEKLAKKLQKLPSAAGVYFHKDAAGEIIYVGKAKNLRNRVKSYFQDKNHDLKTRKLVAAIADTEWLEVETELDALFLESEMIKRYMPKYNILLRDDKTDSYVRIGLRENVPYVSLVKVPLPDGAEYFGPFYSAAPIKNALRVLRRVFPYYTAKTVSKSVLNRNLGLEPAANDAEYRANLKKLMSYLRGNRKKLARDIESEMKAAAREQNFEAAARLRNQLLALKSLETRVVFGDDEFVDISKDKGLRGLAKLLNLPATPRRIEAYDISHTGGKNVVGGMVVFTNGLPDKSQYRKFKVTQDKNDDFAALAEVLRRRFSARNKGWGQPDLILIDGGEPQLRAVAPILDEVGVQYIGIAKNHEEIVTKDLRKTNLHGARHNSGHARNLIGAERASSDVVKLFQRIRDEAHRFAIAYHSSLRAKNMLK